VSQHFLQVDSSSLANDTDDPLMFSKTCSFQINIRLHMKGNIPTFNEEKGTFFK
jgi:hypothetical protein